MPEIVAIRGAGASPGADVVDSLLTTLPACIARGRYELDAHSGLRVSTVSFFAFADLRVGRSVALPSSVALASRVGKITGVTHSFDLTHVSTEVRLAVREAE